MCLSPFLRGCFQICPEVALAPSLGHNFLDLLTLDVEEDGLALHDVGVGGDAIAHAAAVVASRRLLHALQHEHAGVVDGGQHQAGARVRVHALLLQYFALKMQ